MTDRAQGIAWSNQGSELFMTCLDQVPDSAFREPSTLPGWTVAHLVAHVGYNATALSRLMLWARTGIETRMYPSTEARNAEIEHGATLAPEQLRAMVAETDAQLRADFAELPEHAWEHEIVTAQGVPRKAAEIPWMRTREVWIHAVDLGGTEFGNFPPDLLDALITDVTGTRQSRVDRPALAVRPRDRDRTWSVDIPGETRTEVTGSAADLCRWLVGRGALDDAPELSRWL